MSTTTSRLALTQPVGSDPPSALRTSIGGNATILDNAAVYGEGTLVSRGAASASAHGTFYRTTDAGVESLAWSDGSLWLPLGLIPATSAVSASVASGQALIFTGSSAVTAALPSHAAGQMCAVLNRSTGGTTVSGSSIQGLGLSSASSFSLGTVGASAVLLDDGTSWNLIAGQQDTGWVALTLPSGFVVATSAYTPAARIVGSKVELSGGLRNTTGGTVSGTLVTLPSSAFAPASNVGPTAASNDSTLQTVPLFIAASTTAITGTLTNTKTIWLDGASYRLS